MNALIGIGKRLLISSSLIVSVWVCGEPEAIAQIVPDNTLPVGERSQISGNPNIQIDGGARRGNNLFHSFQQFSIPKGSSAFFNNASDIQNIFTRVTGGSISNIDGVIKANGTANLFLLNPNGILFGPNARLNVGGSFVVSTANSINFADGTLFSAKDPQTTPLLTISVPVGLQFGQNPGSITVQGSGYDLSTEKPFFSPTIRGSSAKGLLVQPGKTLALVGGDVNIEGGTLTAELGRIELGSVRSGQVSLSTASGLAFSYQGVERFGDIRLSQQALADASGGGSIQVQGDRILLTDGSIVLIQNQSEQRGGSIDVNATSSVELSGTSPDGASFIGGLRSETTGSEPGADIAVSTNQLVAQNGAGLFTISYGAGRSGNVTVFASDRLRLIGFSPRSNVIQTLINTVNLNSGDAGYVTVSTKQLAIESGAYIGTQINKRTDSTSRGGDVTVNATESVEVIGANNLTASNVSAATNFAGNAGNITINTSRLVARNGGAITTYTLGSGDAGKVTINATKSVEVSGVVQILAPVSSTVSSFGFVYPFPAFPGVPAPVPSGSSGDVIVNTPILSVTDGAKIDVSHQGTGNAGTLRVNANSILLNRGGMITASTKSGEGGNINLQARDLLLMRRNSGITTTAGGTGNGGNININTSSLVAVPNENSDIRADSVNARGGNVTINTDGLFGIQFRPQATASSDITATGANSALNGTVLLNIENINPSQGLVELPTTVVDTSRLIALGCPANRGNSFVVTGRGGLPPTPQQALSNDPLWRDWRTPAIANRQMNTTPASFVPDRNPATTRPTSSSTLVEATGWVIEPNGDIILTATAPTETPYHLWTQPVNCNGS